jgi:hypothetical protein
MRDYNLKKQITTTSQLIMKCMHGASITLK